MHKHVNFPALSYLIGRHASHIFEILTTMLVDHLRSFGWMIDIFNNFEC